MSPPHQPAWGAPAGIAGRDAELNSLKRSYRDAVDGSSVEGAQRLRLLLVDGAAAGGQDTLLDAWLASHRSSAVLDIDADSARERPGMVQQLVEAALSHLSPVRRARHAATRLLKRRSDASSSVVDLMAAAEHRLRLREAVLALLGEIGAANPVIVRLRGLDRAERTTLELLEHVTSDHGPWVSIPRVLFVAAVQGATHPSLAPLAERSCVRTLTLRPLDAAGVRAYLASDEIVAALLELTGGLPDLIERIATGVGLPVEGTRSPNAQAALDALAILDRPTSDSLLEMVMGRMPRLDELALAGGRRNDGRWTLDPELRDHVRAGMSPSDRNALHQRASRALAAVDHAAAARHALSVGEHARACELALRGAEELVARHAAIDAADLLLEVARVCGDATPVELRLRLVELSWIAGDQSHALEHAAHLSSTHPDNAAFALRHGELLMHSGRYVSGLQELLRASDLTAESDTADQHAALAALANAWLMNGEPERALEIAERVAVEGSTVELRLDALCTWAKVELARGQLDLAHERLLRVLAEAETRSLARHACAALNNLALIAMARGDMAQATHRLERMRDVSDAHGAVFYRGMAHKNLAVVHQLSGRWRAALHHAEHSLNLLSGIGHPGHLARLAFNTADLRCALGDPYRALRLCAHARDRAGSDIEAKVDGEGLRVEGAIHRELGHLNKAEDAYTDALRIASALGAVQDATDARLGLAAVRIDRAAERSAERSAERPATTLAAQLDDLLGPVGEPKDKRAAARLALLRARLASSGDRVALARLAVLAAGKTHDPLLEQPARLALLSALLEAGLVRRAKEELDALREREARIEQTVPDALRALFRERSFRRQLATAARGLERNAPLAVGVPEVDAQSLVGRSASMRELREWIARVGPTDSTVLIAGESGTGKELVAEALHAASARSEHPFVRVNCAALVDTLLSSELFGHERGAFTGADRMKKGRFELADGGTILLDEIGDISPRMQAALLRILQERTFERVGGTRTHQVDVRVLAATHRDLRKLVDEGKFREDLYYRLSGITVRVPALRERREDIPLLCRALLARIAHDQGSEPRSMAPGALAKLALHDWPGNVRELENCLHRVTVLSRADLLTAAEFDTVEIQHVSPSDRPPSAAAFGSLGALAFQRVRESDGSIYQLRKQIERECIERALEESEGNISRAAQLLGMKRPRLSKLVNEWGLKK